MDLHRVLAGPRCRGAGQRLAGQPLRSGSGLHRRSGGLRRRICPVRTGLEPEQPDRVPGAAGHPRRAAARRHPDDGLHDRAPEEDRGGDGHVRPRHHLRPGHRSGPGWLPGGVPGRWRLVFYINVPIGVVGVVAAIIALPSSAAAHPEVRCRRFRHRRHRFGGAAAGFLRGRHLGVDRTACCCCHRRSGLAGPVRGDRASRSTTRCSTCGCSASARTASR